VGKRHLETAIAQTDAQVTVEWAPYFLRSNIPENGVPKPGGPGRHQVGQRLRDAGQPVGIDFTGLTDRFPNTMKAHCLLTYALESGGPQVQNQLQEVLFRHYFTDGKYPDVKNLVEAAQEVGLPADDAKRALEEGQFEAQVRREVSQVSGAVTGVPYFIINGKPAFSGAQGPDAFARAFQRA